MKKEDILNDLWTAFGLQKIVHEVVSEDHKDDENYANKFDARLLSVQIKCENGEWETFADIRWRNVDTLYLIHYIFKKEMSTTFKDKKDVEKFFDTCADFICEMAEKLPGEIRLYKLGE